MTYDTDCPDCQQLIRAKSAAHWGEEEPMPQPPYQHADWEESSVELDRSTLQTLYRTMGLSEEGNPMAAPPATPCRAFHGWLDSLVGLSPEERSALGDLAAAAQSRASLTGIAVGAATVTLREREAERFYALVNDLMVAGYVAGLRIGEKRAIRLGAGALAAETELQQLAAWFDHEPVGA